MNRWNKIPEDEREKRLKIEDEIIQNSGKRARITVKRFINYEVDKDVILQNKHILMAKRGTIRNVTLL